MVMAHGSSDGSSEYNKLADIESVHAMTIAPNLLGFVLPDKRRATIEGDLSRNGQVKADSH